MIFLCHNQQNTLYQMITINENKSAGTKWVTTGTQAGNFLHTQDMQYATKESIFASKCNLWGSSIRQTTGTVR